jgi:hypothetical protein
VVDPQYEMNPDLVSSIELKKRENFAVGEGNHQPVWNNPWRESQIL